MDKSDFMFGILLVAVVLTTIGTGMAHDVNLPQNQQSHIGTGNVPVYDAELAGKTIQVNDHVKIVYTGLVGFR